ncbi:MAG: type II methionyl aminopeptidase [Thermoplasmata archaeon]|mgnify:CR=1 FL=1|nr:MAG: type II methionyl aminopeptidase [Thermoplasmata archaeon]
MCERDKEFLERAGAIARKAAIYGKELAREGVALLEIAEKIEEYIIGEGALPAFPANLSVNNIAAHYTPPSKACGIDYVLRRGDVLKIDVGAHVNGYIGDTALTVEIGTSRWRDLIRCAEEALNAAISAIKPGISVRTIGKVVETVASSYGYKPVINLSGHGLGKFIIHTGLTIPNFDNGDNSKLRVGDVIAIEPFVTDGRGYVENGPCGNIYRITAKRINSPHLQKIANNFRTLPFAERWCSALFNDHCAVLKNLERKRAIYCYPTLVEKKGCVVAQAEHTMVIEENGARILTSAK